LWLSVLIMEPIVCVKMVNSLDDIPLKERNLCLVVERPRSGYEDSYGRAGNPRMGVNFERWRYVSDIYVVMPNIQQLYLFRTLEWKHYHCDKDKLLEAVASSKLSIEVHLYLPTEDYVLDCDDFVKVINVDFDETTREAMLAIPWKEIATSIYTGIVGPELEKKMKKKNEASACTAAAGSFKRQKFHVDVGYTTGLCLIGKDDRGVSLPVPKPSTDELHIKAMVALSALLKHHIFTDLKETVYFDAVNVNRRGDFAGKLHADNVLEALRSALSNVLNPCGCHDDGHNDKHHNFSPVVTFSIFVEVDGVVYRLAIIGYSRKSIREYYERRLKPDALLVQAIQTVVKSLPASRTDWQVTLQMMRGCLDNHPHRRMGDTDLGFYVDHCHMNCYRYLSAWIHYASKIIKQFSLSYDDAVGLVIGMYCDNNAIDFVQVARDLLREDDSVVNESLSDLGFSVRQRMVVKKKQIRERYGTGFTYPQRFRYCWQQSWFPKMLDKKNFRAEKDLVATKCRRLKREFSDIADRDSRLRIYTELRVFLQENIFGAGELVSNHLIAIMSVLGMLPSWMSTISYLKTSSNNYCWLVQKYKIGARQADANMFLRRLAYAINRPTSAAEVCPKVPVAVSRLTATAKSSGKKSSIAVKAKTAPQSKSKSRSKVLDREGVGLLRSVDIFYAENVTCKYIRICKKSDSKYFDVVFIGQCVYVPNVDDGSLTIFLPDGTLPIIISAGCLHSWDMDEHVASAIPRKRMKRESLPPLCPGAFLELWVPVKINRSRGMFKRPPAEPVAHVDSVAKHVRSIQNFGNFKSAFTVEATMKGGVCYHMLVSVAANGRVYSMKEEDLSIVCSLMGDTVMYANPIYQKKKDCLAFGNLFLLVMVYPSLWFSKLMGTPCTMDSPTPTVEVRRNMDTMFYLKKLNGNVWQLTPKFENVTYEYK
jgi:hypothetical protein